MSAAYETRSPLQLDGCYEDLRVSFRKGESILNGALLKFTLRNRFILHAWPGSECVSSNKIYVYVYIIYIYVYYVYVYTHTGICIIARV